MTMDGIPGPTLDKLLVDIRRDQNFDYPAGEECVRMLVLAQSAIAIRLDSKHEINSVR